MSLCCFLEQQNTYHGDIRPVNILLTPSGQVKLADHQILQQEKSSNPARPRSQPSHLCVY